MPSRSKRAIRDAQLEEDANRLKALNAPTDQPVEPSDEETDVPAPSAFAALSIEQEESSSDPGSEHITTQTTPKKKSKRRRKSKVATTAATADTDVKSPAVKDLEGPVAQPKVPKAAPLDEIDAALRDINARDAATSTSSREAATLRRPFALKGCLCVDTKNLDADAELKRMFGAKVVNAASNQPLRRGARSHNPHHQAGRTRQGLAKPTAYWPPVHLVKSGLTMEPLENDSATGETWHSFEHSRAYREAQSQFLQAVSSHDPNAIFALLAVQPYHIDSLLQLSEIQAHQGDQGQAEDFLDRALYAMEKAFAPTFQITGGLARLAFNRVENRALFRACERKVSSLMRRGCWRTAFEFARLLLSLSPYDDPYGALLFLDFLAPKTKQTRFLAELIPALTSASPTAVEQPFRYETFPGLAYGHALALFEGEGNKGHEESLSALCQAILRFPAVVLLLFDALDLSYPKSIASLPRAQAPPSDSRGAPLVWILSQLYVHRSGSLWKAPEVKAWLQAAVRQAEPRLHDRSDADVLVGWDLMHLDQPYGKGIFPHGVARHILATDIASIRALLPASVFSSQSFSYDMLPPRQLQGATFYDENYFSAIGGRQRRARQAGLGELNMQRIIDLLQAHDGGNDPGALDELQAIMAQIGELQDDMPGGFAAVPDAPPPAQEEVEQVPRDLAPLRAGPGALLQGWWARLAGMAHGDGTDDDEED